ncbi:hypothetical protein [Nguyenibacter vanlangensis]|uniref:Uncharacterized protein n=1 Tax=Nguyenibacter vanlangensis TaxID=1216886 RepID=A0A7Y7IUQ6_9PROT|nr:hypothetical protein [Nguyenibacter vanlangensis]NVN10622.1 hypothetical protein [Nguyenibacter vanlangensis]
MNFENSCSNLGMRNQAPLPEKSTATISPHCLEFASKWEKTDFAPFRPAHMRRQGPIFNGHEPSRRIKAAFRPPTSRRRYRASGSAGTMVPRTKFQRQKIVRGFLIRLPDDAMVRPSIRLASPYG